MRAAAAAALGVAIALSSATALAAGDAHPVNWKDIGWHAGNLAVFVVLLFILLRKPIRGFLAQRRAVIAEGLEEAARLRTDAATKLQELEARLANLALEREPLLRAYREEGERERALLAEAGQRAAEALRRESKFLMEQETRALRKQIKDRAVEAALTLAEQIVRAQITTHDRVRLADEYIDQLKHAATPPR